MALSFKLPEYPYYIPWFLYDIDNNQLITSKTVPADITDSKSIVYGEVTIPGLDYQPMQYGYGGNNIVSMELQIDEKNNTIGDVLLLKQFDMLRHQATGFTKVTKNKNRTNPKVLYNWGLGTVPLEYYVTKCDFVQKTGFINQMTNPCVTVISITLKLDGESILNEGESAFRELASKAGLVINNFNVIESQL